MKDNLKIISYIVLIILIIFTICCIFIKPKIFNFKTTKEYEYIQNNKKNIDQIIIKYSSQLGESCYKLDIKKGYDILNNITIKKESGWCSAPEIDLKFYFQNGEYKNIHFDCDKLFYDGVNYELKDSVILVNKDEYLPNKITKGMIVVSNKDIVDCK